MRGVLLAHTALAALTVAAGVVAVPVYLHMMVATMTIIYIGCTLASAAHDETPVSGVSSARGVARRGADLPRRYLAGRG
jgi:hypothetical protein